MAIPAAGAVLGGGFNALRGKSIGRGALTGGLTTAAAGTGGVLGGVGGELGGGLTSLVASGGDPALTNYGMGVGAGVGGLGGAAGAGYGGYQLSQYLADKFGLGVEDEKTAMLRKQAGRCWEGYEPVPGKEPYSEDSCRPKGKKAKKKEKKADMVDGGINLSELSGKTIIPKQPTNAVSRDVPSDASSNPLRGFQPWVPGQTDFIPFPGLVEGPEPPPAPVDYSDKLKIPELGYLDTAKLHTRDLGRRIEDKIGLGDRFSGLSPNMQALATLLAGAGGIGALGLGGYGLSRLFGGKDEEEKQPELKIASYTSKPKKNKKAKTKRKGSQMSSYTKTANLSPAQRQQLMQLTADPAQRQQLMQAIEANPSSPILRIISEAADVNARKETVAKSRNFNNMQVPMQREPGTYASSPAGQADLAKLNRPFAGDQFPARSQMLPAPSEPSALDKLTGGLRNAASRGADYSRQAGQFLANLIGNGDQF